MRHLLIFLLVTSSAFSAERLKAGDAYTAVEDCIVFNSDEEAKILELQVKYEGDLQKIEMLNSIILKQQELISIEKDLKLEYKELAEVQNDKLNKEDKKKKFKVFMNRAGRVIAFGAGLYIGGK